MTNTEILSAIRKSLGDNYSIRQSKIFYWSPEDRTVYYNRSKLNQEVGHWSLLHEAAHALLDHQTYHSDYDLLMLEVAAWERAQTLASELQLSIDPEHIQDCLDTYRDWLHERSTCPTCSTVSIQVNAQTYRCHNCQTSWLVSASRFCRPYRLRNVNARKPVATPLATFT